ncbi:cytochrome P450 [Clathrospora elynae]|uniref:Cytochrome P450 n=1 Tax=Clathrospora elynae TaxID=706981 RepID=A0A6A5S3X0_9PLEO|nr:cytochrome P450 [Clathrospora elynae]
MERLHFKSLSTLRTIYIAGNGLESTYFNRMVDVYGKKNLFTFASGAGHSKRKLLLARAYSKSGLSYYHNIDSTVPRKTRDFRNLVDETKDQGGLETFAALRYNAIDTGTITKFLYGTEMIGATTALQGTAEYRAVHLLSLTSWMYSRTGFMDRIVQPLLPTAEPATYTAIRAHASTAMQKYRDSASCEQSKAQVSIIVELPQAAYKHKTELDDLDIASECADLLIAGIDTTSDTLMFLMWYLTLPRNARIQERLIKECQSIPDTTLYDDIVDLRIGDRLKYLNAVVKETLRLFALLPASEPRSSSVDTVIDEYSIPRGTVCSMTPYSLHRNNDVFLEPLKWNPERWLATDEQELTEMKKCALLYRFYGTGIKPGFENIAPRITSRFEVFADDTFAGMKEHTCWIEFTQYRNSKTY